MEELENPLDLIQEYQRTHNNQLRNDLVMQYSHIARNVALQMRGITTSFAQVEDIVNEGILTLMDCLEKYTPDKGMKFENYAYMRIRNANIDFIRKQDWVPRRVRRTAREVSDAYNSLSTELMREPSNKELAEYMEISEDRLTRHYAEINTGTVVSFEELLQNSLSGGDDVISLNISSSSSNLPEKKLMKAELAQQLAAAIDSLTEKEKTVISLYYYEHLKLREIAEIMGVSESRVSQTHSKSIMKMNKRLVAYINGD